jgi:L-threonylcarbamoyladenylate synthase
MDALGDWAAEVPGYAISLARDFWPGPMTLIMKRSALAGDFVTGGQDTVGVRVPDHAVALGLLLSFAQIGGKGIAAPSANRFGNVSPTTAQAVEDELNDYLTDADQILDGGPCQVGVESTIIDCTGDIPRILRPGAMTAEMIKESNHDEFARVLYASLRSADEQKLQTIVIAQPEGAGIAIAIRDRLKRAAFPHRVI